MIASEWAGGERDVSKIAVFSFTVVRGGFLILYLPVLVPVRAKKKEKPDNPREGWEDGTPQVPTKILYLCQSAPVRALVVPVCCERGLYFKNS